MSDEFNEAAEETRTCWTSSKKHHAFWNLELLVRGLVYCIAATPTVHIGHTSREIFHTMTLCLIA
ncbi:uncharacterized protein EI90DRAFT_1467099 [Cantharellus anzutake]|uniref:uncharacterized protein n=1 Tax=Cantharellus anzutake TaxID=1750568 RepID=UPI001907684F|nr:uncharacterized protein EI90DRAFT_1467099 [Cantharellus anzutake]KAF8309611.1 hypothetical protein EI90DRAFT_1467099 [Cantharellus anzutake]